MPDTSRPPSVLVTGANRGLGLELVTQYAADGWRVYACCRDPGAAADSISAAGPPDAVSLHRLDVTEAADVDGLSGELSGVRIDVLVNNAGAQGTTHQRLGDMDYAGWQRVLAVNTMGPLRMIEAFLPHVLAGDQRKIATISSRMGSIATGRDDPRLAYRSSKAAVNMVMTQVARDLVPSGVTVLVLHPGWVRTDMGGPGAALSAAESVAGIREVIARAGPADSGRFIGYDGTDVMW